MKHKKYIIVGSYGSSNIGDEALLSVILYKLQGETVYVLTGDVKDTKRRHQNITDASLHMPFGIRSFFSFKWLKTIKLIRAADVAILGGGGLFTDMRTRKAILLWAWQIFWFKVFRKEIIMVGNSVGPLNTKIGKTITKWALKQCSAISVRDNKSYKIVTRLLKGEKQKTLVIQGADLAFRYVELFDLASKIETRQDKTIAINLRPWRQNPEGISQFISKKVKNGYTIKLIAMEHMDSQLLGKYKQEGCELVTPDSYKALIKELNTCEYAIGMRLHFLIAAAVSGCKVGAIAYSAKVQEVMRQIDIVSIDVKNMQNDTLNSLFNATVKAKNLNKQLYDVKKTLSIF